MLRYVAIMLLLGGIGATLHADDLPNEKLGAKIEPKLVDPDGKPVGFASLAGKQGTVVVFLSFECPNSNGYTPTLLELHKEFSSKGIAFVAIAENDLTAAELKAKVAEFKLPFPVFVDAKQTIADAFKAHTTPEAFVLDQHSMMRYRGRIDNLYNARLKANPKVTEHDLRNALNNVVAGEPVKTPVTKAIGCPIPLRDVVVKTPTKVTYHKDVLPILQKNCQDCHRSGQVGPFALMTYKQAVTWAEDIKEFTANRKMPPWKPADGVAFHNERRLSDAELKTIAAWVDGGTPEGNASDAPKPLTFTEGWTLGKPDMILTASEDFHLGASGPDTFRCYVLPTNLPDDKYIVGFEVKPGNPQIVHHTLNYWELTGKAIDLEKDAQKKAKPDDRDRGPGYSASMGIGFFPGKSPREGVPSMGNFGGWAPGQVARFLPEGTGYLLPKGATIVIQVHYHRNGKPEKDRTQIGLYFAKKNDTIERPYQPIVAGPKNPLFMNIPPNKEDHRIEGSVYLHSEAMLYSVMPHMHLIGKSVRVSLTQPGESKITLVDIPEWDYNWQETYWLKEPIKLKVGAKLDIEAIFDNSTKNPHNPRNPPVTVFFGEQTTNEMLFGFFGTTPVAGKGTTPGENRRVIARPVPPPKP